MGYFALFIFVVIASGGLVLLYQPKSMTYSKLLLSFSGAYLFALIFLHLLPEVYEDASEGIGLYILFGFLLQLGLDYFSKGIEHGHAHYHGSKFPIAIFVGLCLHSFFEGMPILNYSETGELAINYALIMGIMVHKIPIAIVLAGLLIQQFSKLKSLVFISIFAITLPIGSLANISISQFITDTAHYEHIVLAIVIGIMLHVSTTILYETDEAHKFNIKKVTSIIIGFIVAFLTS
jgi:zinc transporter ZupT